MKMNFILSQTCEGALKASLDSLIYQNNLDEDYIVIVPETKSLFVERYLLDNIPSHAFSNIYIYTFSRLLKKLQVKPVLPLNKEAGVMIVRNLIMELENDLLCYKKTASTVGFAENIYETIQQLKSSLISPLELSESAEKCPTALKIKLKDIALLYDSYENYLSEGLVDPLDKLALLEKEVLVSEKIKNANVFVVGFDSLTSSATNVIRSILKNAKSLTVSASFMHPDNKNSHIADNEVYEKLKSLAEENHIKYEPKFIKTNMCDGAKHIYSALYSYPTKSQKSNGFIKIFGATTREIEAKRVASLIKQKILNGECRYKDNCVFLASEDMKQYVIDAFSSFGIPYFSTEQYPFENHQLFLFIKLLFLLVKKNIEAEDMFLFSRLSLLNLDYSKVDDFENYCLKFGINHNRFLKPFTIEDELLANAEEIRKEIITQIGGFFDVYNENLTILEVCEALNAFFKDFNLENKLVMLEKTQNDAGEVRQGMATEQAFEKLNNVLGMLSQFLGSRKMQLDDFYTLIISGLEASDISLLPLSIDNVQIVTSKDGLYNIDNLYIVGATDGNFPHREQDLGLIQDSEITALEGISEKKIEPTIRTINRRERYKIFELLLLPRKNLYISFSERAQNGEEEKMSALVLALADLFEENGEKLKIERINSPYDFQASFDNLSSCFGSKQNVIEFLAECFSLIKDNKQISISDEMLSNLYFAVKDDLSGEIKELFENINTDKKPDDIKNAKDLFFERGTTSISQLESYFSCPFRHFASYGLRLQERKLASMKALDIGDILHSVCEKFVLHTKNHANYDVNKLAENLLNSVLNEYKYSKEENLTLINILKGESKRLLTALDDQLKHSFYKPVMLEQWFGNSNGIEVCKDPEINIVGKIDRVDESEGFFRIIDYKTGKIETSSEDIYYGNKLQLAIYLSAIDKIKKQPAGVLYFPVHNEFQDSEEESLDAYRMKGYLLNDKDAILQMDSNLSLEKPKSHYVPAKLKSNKKAIKDNIIELCDDKNLLTQEELESMKNYAIAVSKKAVQEILGGYHKPTPFKDKYLPCTYCDYRNVCGIKEEEYKSVRQPSNSRAKEFYKEGTSWQ